jgi:hypothetical protein
MRESLERIARKVNKDEVVILFSDGQPTSGSPVSAGDSIKSKGARIITIGCGSRVDNNLMQSLASSAADYHHASHSGQLVSTFRTVAKALAQSNTSLPTAGGSGTGKGGAGNISICKQVNDRAGTTIASQTSSSTTGSQSGSLAADEGFEFVEDFDCHYCSSGLRVVCPHCQGMFCGGAADASTGRFECPSCTGESIVEETSSLHVRSLGGSAGKKGK